MDPWADKVVDIFTTEGSHTKHVVAWSDAIGICLTLGNLQRVFIPWSVIVQIEFTADK